MATRECAVCGFGFMLSKESRYTAIDNKKIDEPEQFDAYDCPICGCQNIIQTRKRRESIFSSMAGVQE